MHLRPILSTLRRHKIAASLIVLEIAITFAIVCNAVFLIAGRIELADRPSGLVESELLRIQIAGIGASAKANERAQTQLDLQVLRALPGVKSATVTNQSPFGGSSSSSSVAVAPNFDRSVISPSTYFASEGFVATTGVRLVAGRDFGPGDYVDAKDVLETEPAAHLPGVILNRAAAERLFPGGNAVGQPLSIFDARTTIVGVVDVLVPPAAKSPEPYSILLPMRVNYNGSDYVLRVDPARRDEILKAAVAALESAGPGRVVQNRNRFDQLRDAYYRTDRSMAWLLVAVCAALLVITALGIVGLASFWVQQRTRMIGTRRALGATRRQIMQYFQAENLLLSGIGIVLGIAGAYGINVLLMRQYEMARLPFGYLPVGALLLFALGQIAVFWPARRAAALPPVVVMRGA
jgi:putative ABC transport system permease protein